MPLITGTPVGSVLSPEELYLEGAPTIYFQNSLANPLKNPDANGFYWGLSGTATYPVYEMGCMGDVSFTENLTANDVLCDETGVKDTIQQRNYVEFNMSIKAVFPFSVLTQFLGTSAVTAASPTNEFGIGAFNNSVFYHLYAPKVYDETVGDYVWIYLHKCKIVDAWSIAMTFGNNWTISGTKFRGFVDGTKPSVQKFGMFGRSDLSLIP